MSIKDYKSYDAMGLAQLIANGDVSATELLQQMSTEIEARDGEVNAVVTTMYDEAQAQIAGGLPKSPLSGVPFMLKDLNLFYAGARTTNGSKMFAVRSD